MDLVLSTKTSKAWVVGREGGVKGTVTFLKEYLAPDVLTKAYPTIPLLAHSELVTQSL
jgi:hypothetical protein